MPSLTHRAQPRRTRATVVAAASLAFLSGWPSLALADYHTPPPPLSGRPTPGLGNRAGPAIVAALNAAQRCDEQEMERHLKSIELAAAFMEGASKSDEFRDPTIPAAAFAAEAARLDAFARDLRAWFKNVCARRVGDQTFYRSGDADKARPAYNKAEAAARDCNRQAYRDAIKELRDLAGALDGEANALLGIPGYDVARSRRANELQQDATAARALAGELEREYNQRFSHCPPEGTATPPLVAPGTTGPQRPGVGTPAPGPGPQPAGPGTQPAGPGTQTPGTATPPGAQPVTPPPPFTPVDPRRAGGEIFNELDLARQARNLLRKAEDAVRTCDRKAYLDAMFELSLLGATTYYRAMDVRAAGTPAAQQRAREISENADALTRLANQLNAQFDSLFKNCPDPQPPAYPVPPPGSTYFGAVTPQRPNYAFNVNAGGNVSWVPRVSGGTIIPNLGVAGTELPLVWSPGTLTGASFSMGAKIPLSITPLDREWTFMPRVLYGYADGRASGMIAPGGVFTGRTFLSPAPDGSTGVFYGMTGQAIDIRTRTHQFGTDLLVGTRLWGGQSGGWRYSVFAGGGFSYRFDWTGHTIDERNLSFDNIWSRTELTTDNHFFGARLAAGAKLENGAWHGSAAAYLTPGLMFAAASATQRNVCALCAPAVQDFSLKHEKSRTAFGVRTGVDLHLGYRITRSISVGGFFSFDFSSSQATWVNPVTPRKNAPDLGIQDATSLRFGAVASWRF